MSRASEQVQDPLRWCAALALAFWLACLPYLTAVPHPYFDEVHYLPAARELLVLGEFTNREHPLLGKQLIALGIALFGDNPVGWRLLPTLLGTLALFGAMRALWFASASRFATLAYGVLLATGFHLFVHARIAMLDIVYLAFLALAAWQFAAGCCSAAAARPSRGPRCSRPRCGSARCRWRSMPRPTCRPSSSACTRSPRGWCSTTSSCCRSRSRC
jgi:hypothetical protein